MSACTCISCICDYFSRTCFPLWVFKCTQIQNPLQKVLIQNYFSPPFFCSFVPFLLTLVNRMGLSYSSLQPSKFVWHHLKSVNEVWDFREPQQEELTAITVLKMQTIQVRKKRKSESFRERATFFKRKKQQTGLMLKEYGQFSWGSERYFENLLLAVHQKGPYLQVHNSRIKLKMFFVDI